MIEGVISGQEPNSSHYRDQELIYHDSCEVLTPLQRYQAEEYSYSDGTGVEESVMGEGAKSAVETCADAAQPCKLLSCVVVEYAEVGMVLPTH